MCHGLVFGSIATWYFTAAAKLASRFEVILYDQRGHGKSELTPTGYDLDTLACDLEGLLEHIRSAGSAGPVALVGHSYGALVALNYALKHPSQVSKLVLIDAPLPASRYVYPSMAGVDSREALAACIPDDIKKQIEPDSRASKRMQERLEYLFLNTSLRQDVRDSADIDDAFLKKLDIPVLCLYGRNSDCLDAGERLARVLPNAQLQLLECGHYIPLETPKEMTKALDEFL
jgi:pimeloyl-ACP methyl ester carboxylesterase